MNVDKPWGHHQALSIDHLSSLLYRNMRFNRCNFLPCDGHIGCKPSLTCTIDHRTIFDQKIKHFCPLHLSSADLFRRLRSMRPTLHQHAGLRFIH